MELILAFFEQLWLVTLEAAPWLLLGLIVAGLMKSFMPTALLSRWLGGQGFGPVFRAAIIGTPFPLCSCSVVPAAIELRRGGASKASTVSFLVSTPENGADSVALSYALLGPFMMIARLVTAIFSAVWAGMATVWLTATEDTPSASSDSAMQSQVAATDCCSQNENQTDSIGQRTVSGLRYAVFDLYQDIAPWMAVGLALAAAINTVVPAESLAQWGSGLPVMLLMLVIGVPMYICATASTPIAASMLIAGVSPGTVLVFLLAGPATNLGTLGIVRKELGNRATSAYLLGVGGGALLCGYLTDLLISHTGISVFGQVTEAHHVIPDWASVISVVVLGVCSLWMLKNHAMRWQGKNAQACCGGSCEAESNTVSLNVMSGNASSCCNGIELGDLRLKIPARPCCQDL